MKKFKKILSMFSSDNQERITQLLESFNEESGLNGKNFVAVIKDFSGPHAIRGWDVRIRTSIVHLFVWGKTGGKIYRHEFAPYFEYEDYPGGQTYWHKQYYAKKIQSVELIDDKWKVTLVMEEGSLKTVVPFEAQNFERHYQQGDREKFFNTSMEIRTRLTYNGDPQDLDFSGSEKDSTDL